MIDKATSIDLQEHIPDKGFVTWIKIPVFQVAWMYSNFGFPCVIPSNNELNWVMRRGLTKNHARAIVSTCSCTDVMWHDNTLKISDEDKACFVAIALPKHTTYKRNHIKPTDNWQLDRSSTVDFRKEVRHQFWKSLSSYISDTTYHAVKHSTYTLLEEQVQDWMELNGIDIDHFESIYRQWYRDRMNDEREINKRLRNTRFDIVQRRQEILASLRERKKSGRSVLQSLMKRVKERGE